MYTVCVYTQEYTCIMYTQRKTTLLRWHFEFGAISISPPVCSLPVRFLSMQDIAASS